MNYYVIVKKYEKYTYRKLYVISWKAKKKKGKLPSMTHAHCIFVKGSIYTYAHF